MTGNAHPDRSGRSSPSLRCSRSIVRMNDVSWKRIASRFRTIAGLLEVEKTEVRPSHGAAIVAHRLPPIALAFSPDARFVAASGGGRIPGRVDVRVFDVETRALRASGVGHT